MSRGAPTDAAPVPPRGRRAKSRTSRIAVSYSGRERVTSMSSMRSSRRRRRPAPCGTIDERGERMPEMQIAVRARRKAEYRDGHRRVGDSVRSQRPIGISYTMTRLIDSEQRSARGAERALLARDPRFDAIGLRAGLPPLRRRPGGFAGLVSIVVSQQLSTASATLGTLRGRSIPSIRPVPRRVPPGSSVSASRRRNAIATAVERRHRLRLTGVENKRGTMPTTR